MPVDDCLFCGIIEGRIPSDGVYEDEVVVAFRDISPQAPTHVLVVPRRHIEHAGAVVAGDGEVLEAMVLAAQRVAEIEGIADPERGFRLVFNVGADALNSVPHLHLHVLGGRSLSWPPG
jgi:histidine triad (HIT) family protein